MAQPNTPTLRMQRRQPRRQPGLSAGRQSQGSYLWRSEYHAARWPLRASQRYRRPRCFFCAALCLTLSPLAAVVTGAPSPFVADAEHVPPFEELVVTAPSELTATTHDCSLVEDVVVPGSPLCEIEDPVLALADVLEETVCTAEELPPAKAAVGALKAAPLRPSANSSFMDERDFICASLRHRRSSRHINTHSGP